MDHNQCQGPKAVPLPSVYPVCITGTLVATSAACIEGESPWNEFLFNVCFCYHFNFVLYSTTHCDISLSTFFPVHVSDVSDY